MKHHRVHIYTSRWHLLATLLFIVVPFVFLFFFSTFAHIAASTLASDVLISFARLLVAYIIAAVLGWTMAVAFYSGKRSIVALPLFDVLQSFPTFAALPVAMFAWGATNFTVVFFLVITVIWPIFFSILSSLKMIKHDWQEAAEMEGLTGFLYVRKFLLPVSIPGLITGSIVGLGEGWEALVATEIIVQMRTGLGQFFNTYSYSVPITVFGILGFLILIFSINKLLWIPLLDWSHHKLEE